MATANSIDAHWSKQYENRDFRALFTATISLILSRIPVQNPKTCLDIGCGTGGLTRELYHRGYSCIGIDTSTTAIDIASQATIYKDALKYIHGDFEMDSPSELDGKTFSLITCKLVYAFIQDRPAFLEKISSSLSDKGTFVMITPVYEKEEGPSPIGVERLETIAVLEKQFSHVDQINIEWAICFICSK